MTFTGTQNCIREAALSTDTDVNGLDQSLVSTWTRQPAMGNRAHLHPAGLHKLSIAARNSFDVPDNAKTCFIGLLRG